MFNQSGVTVTKGAAPVQILANVELQFSMGVVVNQSAGTDDGKGKKIVKAGTPLTGNLDLRLTAFTAATEAEATGSDAVGVLLHDVDVTKGNANGTLLLFGFVNTNRLDSTVKGKITDAVKKALTSIRFIAC